MRRIGLNFVKRRAGGSLLAALLIAAAAYWPAANAGNGAADGGPQDLATLVGPIALYPDDLVAVILPASTYPVQIVEAARFLDQHRENRSLQPDPSWDDTVVALLNYPEVLRMMSANLNWTTSLGQAVLDSQAGVMNAIQTFRDRAYAAGNLRSDEHETVSRNADGTIEIQPTDPAVVYIPYYEPARAVVYETVPVVHYYAHPFPLYYYPYPAGYLFSINFFWGVTSAFSISWSTHALDYCAPSFRGHPYHGRRYYAPYYVRHDRRRDALRIDARKHVWHSSRHRAAGPERRASYVTRRANGNRRRVDANRFAVAGNRGRTAVVQRHHSDSVSARTSSRHGATDFRSHRGFGGTAELHGRAQRARQPQTHAYSRNTRSSFARRGAVRTEQPYHRPRPATPARRSAPARTHGVTRTHTRSATRTRLHNTTPTRTRSATPARSAGRGGAHVRHGRSNAGHTVARRAESRAARTHGRSGGRRTQRR